MTLLTRVGHAVHLPHHVGGAPRGAADSGSAPARPAEDPDQQPSVGGRVYAVQRVGALAVGLVLMLFGLLGLSSGAPFLSTRGEIVLGLSANGSLSAVSVVVAVVLVGAALRGPRLASTVMIVLGVLFLLSALVNLALLGTSYNLLAFQMTNVVFSVVVGLLLLVLGCYGRVGGHLPEDSPYAHPHTQAPEPPDGPATPEEVAAEAAMRWAEIAVSEHHATADQRERVAAMARVHTRADRRRVWMDLDRVTAGPTDSVAGDARWWRRRR